MAIVLSQLLTEEERELLKENYPEIDWTNRFLHTLTVEELTNIGILLFFETGRIMSIHCLEQLIVRAYENDILTI